MSHHHCLLKYYLFLSLISHYCLIQAKIFKFVDGNYTWDEAVSVCEKLEGRLASIEQRWELEEAKISSFAQMVWISGTDDFKENDWRWITGRKVFFSLFPAEKRDSSDDECQHCIAMDSYARYSKQNCQTARLPALCEFNNLPPLSDARINAITVRSRNGLTCIITQLKTVRCFGRNDYGQLGLGYVSESGPNDNQLIDIPNLVNIKDIGIGAYHVCALALNGSVFCWGSSLQGQVGNTLETQLTPKKLFIPPVSGVAVIRMETLTVGLYHNCGRVPLNREFRCFCWGWDDLGQSSGHPSTFQVADINEMIRNPKMIVLNPTPLNTTGQGNALVVQQVVAGGYHTCIKLQSTDYPHCFGLNDRKQVAEKTSNVNLVGVSPIFTTRVPYNSVKMFAGKSHSCFAARDSDIAYCWGSNFNGELGVVNADNQTFPPVEVRVKSDGTNICGCAGQILTAALGDSSTCVLLAGGNGEPIHNIYFGSPVPPSDPNDIEFGQPEQVKCAGLNDFGQLGRGNINNAKIFDKNPIFLPVNNLAFDVWRLGGEEKTYCIISRVHRGVKCWGRNLYGELGFRIPDQTRASLDSFNPLFDRYEPVRDEYINLGCLNDCPFLEMFKLGGNSCLCSNLLFNQSLDTIQSIDLTFIIPQHVDTTTAFIPYDGLPNTNINQTFLQRLSFVTSETWLVYERNLGFVTLLDGKRGVNVRFTIDTKRGKIGFEGSALEAVSTKLKTSRIQIRDKLPRIQASPGCCLEEWSLLGEAFVELQLNDFDWPCPHGSYRSSKDRKCVYCPMGTYEDLSHVKRDVNRCENLVCDREYNCPLGAVKGLDIPAVNRYCQIPKFNSFHDEVSLGITRFWKPYLSVNEDTCVVRLRPYGNVPSWFKSQCSSRQFNIELDSMNQRGRYNFSFTHSLSEPLIAKSTTPSFVELDITPIVNIILPDAIGIGFINPSLDFVPGQFELLNPTGQYALNYKVEACKLTNQLILLNELGDETNTITGTIPAGSATPVPIKFLVNSPKRVPMVEYAPRSIDCLVFMFTLGSSLVKETIVSYRNISFSHVNYCPAGYFSSSGTNSFGCSPCTPGTYSQYRGMLVCNPCPRDFPFSPEGATSNRSCGASAGFFLTSEGKVFACDNKSVICTTPGTTTETLTLGAGYWRANKHSTEILPCVESQYCLGGANSSCLENHTGIMCSQCLNSSYAKSGTNKYCQICTLAQKQYDTGRLSGWAFFLLAILVSVFYLIWSIQRNNQVNFLNQTNKGTARRSCSRAFAFLISGKIVIPIQIVFAYFQILAGLEAFFPLDASVAVLTSFLRWIALFGRNFLGTIFTGCSFESNQNAYLLVATLIPLCCCLFVAILYQITKRMDKSALAARIAYYSTEIAILFLVYPATSSTILSTFRCSTLKTGETFLETDPTTNCSSPEYLAIFGYAIFATIAFIFFIPLLFAYLLFSHIDRKHLKRKYYPIHLIILWRPFKDEYFYFELMDMLRKLLLTSVVLFVSGVQGKLQFLLGCSFVFLVLHHIIRPYFDREHNLFFLFTNWCFFWLVFTCLLLTIYPNQSSLRQLGVAFQLLPLIICFGLVVKGFIQWCMNYNPVHDSERNIQEFQKRLAKKDANVNEIIQEYEVWKEKELFAINQELNQFQQSLESAQGTQKVLTDTANKFPKELSANQGLVIQGLEDRYENVKARQTKFFEVTKPFDENLQNIKRPSHTHVAVV